MKEPYTTSNLNATLERWLQPGNALKRDCAGCAKSAKCCDFQPFVPIFLLGGWLVERNELPEIKNVYFAPIGAIASPAYRARFEEDGGVKQLCGFFSEGSCTIWRFRPSECSTYFCESERPKERDLGFAVETAVAQMALVELGLTAREIEVQVDLVNGAEPGIFSGPEMLMMYKKAWRWSQTLSAETIKSWT